MTETTLETVRQTPFPFQLFAATEAVANSRTGSITRKNYELCTVEYVSAGAGGLEINGHSYHPVRDSVYVLSQYSTHTYWPDRNDPWQKLFFVISGDMMHYLLKAYRLEEVYYIPNCPGLKKHFEAMFTVNHNSPDSNQQAALIFHQFVEEAARIVYGMHTKLPPEVEQLKGALDEALEGGFNLEEYAGKQGFSEAHLIRSFRHAFNTTPYEYLMNKKIEMAKRLLLYSKLSVKEIAAQLSFSDQYYFSNYFKRKTGTSPRSFRNQFPAKVQLPPLEEKPRQETYRPCPEF